MTAMQLLDGNEMRSAQTQYAAMVGNICDRPTANEHNHRSQALWDQYVQLAQELKDLIAFNVKYRVGATIDKLNNRGAV